MHSGHRKVRKTPGNSRLIGGGKGHERVEVIPDGN